MILTFTDEMRKQKKEKNVTQETTASAKSETLGTPTRETITPTGKPSVSEVKQSSTLTTPKKSNKKSKVNSHQVPKENTTSPPGSKANSKIKAGPKKKTKEVTTPYVKLIRDNTPSTAPKESSVSKRGVVENSETQFSKYDTLVCYAKENQETALELKQFLETECGLQVCIDLENFMPGKATTDNIIESINASRSVIFLLSHEFLNKFWAQWELKHTAYSFNASQNSGNGKKIIPLLLEECEIPNELKIYTAIKMEASGSKKDCWQKVTAAIIAEPDDYVADGHVDDHEGEDGATESGCQMTGTDVNDSGSNDDDVDDNDTDDDNSDEHDETVGDADATNEASINHDDDNSSDDSSVNSNDGSKSCSDDSDDVGNNDADNDNGVCATSDCVDDSVDEVCGDDIGTDIGEDGTVVNGEGHGNNDNFDHAVSDDVSTNDDTGNCDNAEADGSVNNVSAGDNSNNNKNSNKENAYDDIDSL